MPDFEKKDQSPTVATRQAEPKPRWGLRIGLGIAAVALLAIVYLIVRLFLPVWWATNIGNQTQGSLSSGIILGLVYGFVFTFVPLLIIWQARYKKVSWPWKSVIVIVAILLAIPNLLTLSIYANSSSAAAKARSMIDISATYFPSWSIGGAAAALVLFVGIAAFWHLWHSRGKKLKAMKSDMKTQAALRDAESSAPTAESGRDGSRPVAWSPTENAEHPKSAN
ncbi:MULTISPECIES: hypothetical protein [Paeniglutamicibacter]|jgi:hypothetical protein|uniref:Sterol desaturase/sphingolipid hydroxylase (Fatty acid hydroxylase superfamily) n=1 Tax=Paeniglutamicibacter sulfureus TaxID=43666 RepID=A0ABU2BEQ0_9MICC|nr:MULTISPECIES: hypothetical protein [Paeniglutamicibacter]MCV9995473.1 hypothetical protein [Paeniglutamicibacter sp. ZC-3]MDO2932805.1 hypothetical protein [Paeniglutamicibacter sulfureus]MDR7357078.1 sterol desaturase/sphingolipid hydroxylase (fatty acid hydroxylase superfamily) [Paeniglutamicibacter sulfureus]